MEPGAVGEAGVGGDRLRAVRFHAGRSHGGRHQLYLARGIDRAGNAYGDPARVHQAWIDAPGFFIPEGH